MPSGQHLKEHQSAKGERKGGRKKGTANKTTTLLKDAILRAAEIAGNNLDKKGKEPGLVKYLSIQANRNPKTFVPLLGKVLPLQIKSDCSGPVIAVIERHIIKKK